MSDRSKLLGLAAFHDWAGKQPPDGTYNYWDCRGCAYEQYLESLGFEDPSVDCHSSLINGAIRPLPPMLDTAVALLPHTYGALTQRLARRL